MSLIYVYLKEKRLINIFLFSISTTYHLPASSFVNLLLAIRSAILNLIVKIVLLNNDGSKRKDNFKGDQVIIRKLMVVIKNLKRRVQGHACARITQNK